MDDEEVGILKERTMGEWGEGNVAGGIYCPCHSSILAMAVIRVLGGGSQNFCILAPSLLSP